MSYKEGLLQWQEMLSRHLPHLSRPQRVVLASWSYATVTLGKAGISCVSAWLALMDAEGASKPAAWRQRLREWCYDASDKKGAYQKGVHRQEIDVRLTSIWIVRWLLAWWDPTDRRMFLAIDASSRSSKMTWCVCVSSIGARPFRWRGKCCLPARPAPGTRPGKPCWSKSKRWSLRSGGWW